MSRILGRIDNPNVQLDASDVLGEVVARRSFTGECLDNFKDPFGLYRCHTMMNCAKAWLKGSTPSEAIAELRLKIVEHQF